MDQQIVLVEMKLLQYLGLWRKALQDVACGPLIVAHEVVDLADRWDAYREQAGGLDATTWLKRNLNWYLAWFIERQRAVDKLGEAVRRWMHHEVAVYCSRNVPAEDVREVVKQLRLATKKAGENPLSLPQAKPIIYEVLGRRPGRQRRTCPRCAVLEALLREHGIEVPEVE